MVVLSARIVLGRRRISDGGLEIISKSSILHFGESHAGNSPLLQINVEVSFGLTCEKR